MRFRHVIWLVTSVCLFTLLGLAALMILTAGLPATRASARPERAFVATPRQGFGTPVAYVTVTPTPAAAATQATFIATGDELAAAAVSTPAANTDSVIPAPDTHPVLLETNAPADGPAVAPGSSQIVNPPPGTVNPAPLSGSTTTPAPQLTGTPSGAPTPTSTPPTTTTIDSPARLSGRVLLNGIPVREGVALRLEDRANRLIGETVTDSEGRYVFANLPPTPGSYHLVFAQEWNTGYPIEQVISWGWIGPVALKSGADVQLPDLDISLRGFAQTNPAPNSVYSLGAISAEAPIEFEWTAYPGAEAYWVDLAHGEDEQELVWQSSLSRGEALTFDGTLKSGSRIAPGDYWWGIGARSSSEPYPLTVYGYLSVLRIKP